MDRSNIISPGSQERRLVLLLPRPDRHIACGQERLLDPQRGNASLPAYFKSGVKYPCPYVLTYALVPYCWMISKTTRATIFVVTQT